MPATIPYIHKNLNPNRQHRHAVNEAEWKAIQQQHHDHPDWNQKQLQAWFLEAYQQSISQSTISDSLHSWYKHLNSKHIQQHEHGPAKWHQAAYSILEEALFEWQQHLQHKRVPITGDMIQKAASQLWKMIPALACNSELKFSTEWVDDFKRRHRIKKYKQHDEAESADVADSEERMTELQNIVKKYEMQNTYNMNEAALYWRMVPDVTLATEHQTDSKRQKKHLSVMTYCNVNESHKLFL